MATKGKVRDMIKIVTRDGWMLTAQVGSHRQYTHPIKSGRVTIAGHEGTDMPVKTWNSILKQAGLR